MKRSAVSHHGLTFSDNAYILTWSFFDNMVENQTRIMGHVEIAGLGCNGSKLKGKNVIVFTIDGKEVAGDVIEANYIAVYVAESTDRARMIKASAIASISMSKEDAEQLLVKDNRGQIPPILPAVPKKIISAHNNLPRI